MHQVSTKSLLKTHDDSSPHNVEDTDTTIEQEPAPIPPKPPRSAFMCYTDAMREEIMSSGGTMDVNEEKILNNVATKWKSLTDRQRAEWEEVSRQDKVR
jgi:hypothetical protein